MVEVNYKMVEVNVAYNHGRYEKKSLRVMSNVKVFPTQDGRPAGRMNTTYYIDPCVTQTDKKKNVDFSDDSHHTIFDVTLITPSLT